MFTPKKILIFGIVLSLFMLVACQATSDTHSITEVRTQSTINISTTEMITERRAPSVPTTEVIRTVLHLPDRLVRTNDLVIFFEKYKEIMIELTIPLLDQRIQRANIINTFTGPHYYDKNGNIGFFGEELTKKFLDYLAIVSAESNLKYESGISVKEIKGKRVISFYFAEMDEWAEIVYMPDGYVQLTFAESSRALPNETKLAEDWYSYYFVPDWLTNLHE